MDEFRKSLRMGRPLRAALVAIPLCLTLSAAAPAANHKAHKTLSHAVKAHLEPADAMVGIWMLKRGEKLDPSTKIVFRRGGSFLFAGATYRSAGSYTLTHKTLSFHWTSVDGHPVKGGLMHQDYMLAEDGTFTIDRFTYAKHPLGGISADEQRTNQPCSLPETGVEVCPMGCPCAVQ